ncbi:MAG: hypothetical protein AAGL89_01225 [Pseudomonadota bacterium]
MKKIGLVLAAATLSGCLTAPLSDVEDYSALSWGNEGSLFGAIRTTLTPDDLYVVEVRGADGQRRQTVLQGPDGAFADLVVRADAGLRQIDDAPADSICLDYGTDFVELIGVDGRVVARSEAQCPGSDVEPLLRALSDRLRPADGP